MNALFICDAGRNRSPTGVGVIRKLWGPDATRNQAESIGFVELNGKPHREIAQQLSKYDFIFCMDERTRTKLRRRYGIPPQRIHNLDIPDRYDRADDRDFLQLEAILVLKLTPLLDAAVRDPEPDE
ncbi:MAG: hypothetical protein B6D36_13300 [Planctomycetes bacterium UTPLA1]|nr:MAG: hypothetical protein B6D36_13300 [Planctomycetes bacterium UTPLA1]